MTMRRFIATFLLSLTVLPAVPSEARPRSRTAQEAPAATGTFEVANPHGKVSVRSGSETSSAVLKTVGASGQPLRPGEISESRVDGRRRWTVRAEGGRRIDVELFVPKGAAVIVRTEDGEVKVAGPVSSATVVTETGTIATDIPFSQLGYRFTWTESRPRILSSFDVAEAKERKAGRFVAEGMHRSEDPSGSPVKLDLTTGRGIVLVNVSSTEVPSNLEERPLTEAAKAIVRSGDSILTEAIRRVSPKYFGDFAKTLPPPRAAPALGRRRGERAEASDGVRSLTVQVVDSGNRAVADVTPSEFEVTENGEVREIVEVRPASAPFNLVLLLDVSGSVENHLDFIRKAARAFIDTADPRDRIAIVVFSDDAKVVSGFSGDRAALSASLDTFDAGGGTAYYDALGLVLVDVLPRAGADRTAVVVLSDGDDNRSFIPFEALTGSSQESGALIYPLYVPSALIANSRLGEPEASVDPLRRKYVSLTSKAEGEGARLASVSGGRYYPIRRLAEIQLAYDDIVRQLRTAYTLIYRSAAGASGRVKVSVKRDGVYVKADAGPAFKD